uniref:Calmodulin-binding protein n=1 Tax=Arundo donax TaxID=35708 RepID=A0A0A8XQ86_ARUDO
MSFSRPRRDREEEDGHAGGDDHRGSMPAKRPRRCSCCQEAKDFYEGQIEILKKEMQCMSKGFIEERKNLQREMQEFYQNSQLQLCELISEQHKRMELISEQFNTLISDIRTPGDHVWKYSNFRALSHQNKIRTYRLKFENKCCNAKYSRHDITADDGNPIKVAIYDHDNQIISNGSLSSMQVQIVVLDGEFNKENKEQWSRDSFIKSIVYGRTGKLPLFANELYLRLENGVANLFDAKFQDNSSFVPSKKFRLGVTATDDSISKEVLEGISESFAVKDGRGFQAKKEPYPSLSDPIYKLKKIAVNGDRRKLLEKMHIKLVRDFLRFYNKDKNCLRKVCGNISDHDWDIIVKHALSCKPGHEHYSYDIPAMDATIFFNSLYKIVGAEFNGKYTFYEELNDTQKGLLEASKTKAYDNLKLVQYEDKNSYHGQCQGSMPPSPTSSPMFHDESSYHREVLESHPEQESPRPCQRWVKIVTLVKTIHFWNKESMWSASIREMLSTPLTESFGMADMLDN